MRRSVAGRFGIVSALALLGASPRPARAVEDPCLRAPDGPATAAPPAPRLSCDAQVLEKAGYHVTQLEPGLELGPWRAVCPAGGGGMEVRTVKLALKKYRDASVDEPDEHTGRDVKVKGCEAPAFLFKNVWGTKDGPLPIAKVTAKKNGWNSTADVLLGATTYHLRIQSPTPAKDEDQRPWKILLDANGATEELDTGTSGTPPDLAVRWAGDLDGDGRPDLLLENHGDGGSVELGLYTSAAASRGRQVKLIASRSRGGS